MTWAVVFLDEGVQADLNAMPLDIQASFRRIVKMIGSVGLERMREPYVKHLQGPVWEMRLKGKDGIARAVLRHRRRPAHRHRPCVCKENAKDPAPRS